MNLPKRPQGMLRLAIILFFAGALALAGCGRIESLLRPTPPPTTQVPEVACPLATPEYFDVQPVTSPTNELTQTILVELGNGEAITVTAESGVFTAPVETYPTEIEITLLPNTTHNLTVVGKVREIPQGDCTYGGYILETTRDRNGDALIIEQRSE